MENISLLFCRPGFENDLAGELMQQAAEAQVGGYCKTLKGQGLVLFHGQGEYHFPFRDLVFARQMVKQVQTLKNLPEDDRISPILSALEGILPEKKFRDVVLESPDTNDGKSLSRFLKKFIHPLAKTIKKNGYQQDNGADVPFIHVCFTSYEEAYVGISYEGERSPFPGGIRRLKFPKDGPSRSTLKLEEAFLDLLPRELFQELKEKEGLVGVDLGAAPGGWTYQLVKHGIFTYAVDNGPMEESLVSTGLVDHHQEDAYKFQPRGHVDILVCDMVDKPSLVVKLMKHWLGEGLCDMAVFNLKLPMKKRHQEVQSCLDELRKIAGLELRAKQLYHDREEITVWARRS